MGLYRDLVLPCLIDKAMRMEALAGYRRRVAAAASGRVLEIGVGSGLNLALYGERVTSVVGLDTSPRLLAMARAAARDARCAIALIEASAEAIPLDDRSVDTAVTTWTLCSVPDAGRALAEIRRVMRPGGQVLFAEHGRAPDARVQRWQDRLTPLWRRAAGGCHLNRPVPLLLESAGFVVEACESGYIPGPRPWTFMSTGRALRPDG